MKKILIILLTNLILLISASSFSDQLTEQTTNAKFFKQHSLFFFFASSCQLCHDFAPLLKSWADSQDTEVIAFSLDNEPLSSFPKFYIPPTELINTAFQDQAIATPALFIANNTSNILYPVAFGALAKMELNERLQKLVSAIKFYEGDND